MVMSVDLARVELRLLFDFLKRLYGYHERDWSVVVQLYGGVRLYNIYLDDLVDDSESCFVADENVAEVRASIKAVYLGIAKMISMFVYYQAIESHLMFNISLPTAWAQMIVDSINHSIYSVVKLSEDASEQVAVVSRYHREFWLGDYFQSIEDELNDTSRALFLMSSTFKCLYEEAWFNEIDIDQRYAELQNMLFKQKQAYRQLIFDLHVKQDGGQRVTNWFYQAKLNYIQALNDDCVNALVNIHNFERLVSKKLAGSYDAIFTKLIKDTHIDVLCAYFRVVSNLSGLQEKVAKIDVSNVLYVGRFSLFALSNLRGVPQQVTDKVCAVVKK